MTQKVTQDGFELYSKAVARHYSAYRPPLHELILSRAIDDCEIFSVGVDIGCGTGYSAIALAKYCNHVFGVEPSQAMLTDAEEQPQITYVLGGGDDLKVIPTIPVKVVTFAGSLFYAKTNQLRQELNNICAPGATVIVYDFEVLLDEVLARFNLECPTVDSVYDHAVNLADWKEFSVKKLDNERLQLDLTSQELGHVLMADANRYEAIARKTGMRDPYEYVVKKLDDRGGNHSLNTKIFLSRYEYSS